MSGLVVAKSAISIIKKEKIKLYVRSEPGVLSCSEASKTRRDMKSSGENTRLAFSAIVFPLFIYIRFTSDLRSLFLKLLKCCVLSAKNGKLLKIEIRSIFCCKLSSFFHLLFFEVLSFSPQRLLPALS